MSAPEDPAWLDDYTITWDAVTEHVGLDYYHRKVVDTGEAYVSLGVLVRAAREHAAQHREQTA